MENIWNLIVKLILLAFIWRICWFPEEKQEWEWDSAVLEIKVFLAKTGDFALVYKNSFFMLSLNSHDVSQHALLFLDDWIMSHKLNAATKLDNARATDTLSWEKSIDG